MGREIYLKLDTEYGVITIPFKSIEDVDDFTVRYSDMGMLVTSIIKLLQLQIDLYDVTAVYLTDDKYKMEIDSKCLPIKYSRDNFNYESLFKALVKYIKDDCDRILTTDIKYVKSREVFKYIDSRMLDNVEIERIVRAYLGDTGYKRKRNTYFLIKDEEGISIKIDPLSRKSDINRDDLSIYSTEEDDYLNHLIELSKKDPETFSKSLDQIAQSNLEDLSGLLRFQGYGIVDGVSDVSEIVNGDIKVIEETTGLSIDELREKHTVFGRKRKHRQ